MAHPAWPLFDLVVRTPMLELRLPTDDLVFELAAVGRKGIHDPSWQPLGGWTDAEPEEVERRILKWNWKMRAEWEPTSWSYNSVVLVDGRVAGTQGMSARDFGALRVVATGSWLGQDFQGRGIGREMRAAMLHLAFAGLEADEARSGYWEDNERSRRVSAGLGYEVVDVERKLRRDERTDEVHVKLSREAWEARRRDDIHIEGLDACLPWFVGPLPGAPT